MKGTFGSLDSRQKERMRLALTETLATHFASPAFFDPRQGAERVHPLDRPSLEAIAHFVNSVNFAPLDALDLSSNEARRFFEGLMLRFLDVNTLFKKPRYTRLAPALRARSPRLAADIHRGLLASLDGKAPNFGMGIVRRSWAEGRERARKIPKEEYERTSRILEAAIIRSRIDDYTASGFVPQSEPVEVARRPQPAPSPAPSPARHAPAAGAWPENTATELTVPVSATGFAAAFNALGIAPTDQMGTVSAPQRNGAKPPRELPNDLYELYGDYLQDMQPDTAVTPAVRQPPPASAYNASAAPWQSGPVGPAAPASAQPQPMPAPMPQMPPMPAPIPGPQQMNHPPGPPAPPGAASHNDLMVFWQLRYQLEAYVRRAAESYGLSYNGSDPTNVLDALRQSGFVDEADLRIAEGILALTDRVTRSTTVAIEDYRQAFLLYLLYHRSHLGV